MCVAVYALNFFIFINIYNTFAKMHEENAFCPTLHTHNYT